MTDRVEQTYALLRSLADWEPSPRIAVARGAIRGESPGRLEECVVCEGTGRRGGSTFPCRVCKGRGRVPIDPQTLHVVTDHEDSIEQLIRRRRDRCSTCGGSGLESASSDKDPGLFRDVYELEPRTGRYVWRQDRRPPCPDCAGTGTREVVVMADEPDEPWLDETRDPLGVEAALERKQTQWSRGSYAALTHRLVLLRAEYPWAARMLDRHLIHPFGAKITAAVDDRIDWAVRWIEQGMPYPIQVPEEATRWNARAKPAIWRGRTGDHQRVRSERDQAVVAAAAASVPVASVAAAFHLSERRVRQIFAL